MKQTVRLAGGINELFGTLDENLKLFESSLHVKTHLRDHDLEIEGQQSQVERAAQILGEYNQRILDGRVPSYPHSRPGQEDRRPQERPPEALHGSSRDL